MTRLEELKAKTTQNNNVNTNTSSGNTPTRLAQLKAKTLQNTNATNTAITKPTSTTPTESLNKFKNIVQAGIDMQPTIKKTTVADVIKNGANMRLNVPTITPKESYAGDVGKIDGEYVRSSGFNNFYRNVMVPMNNFNEGVYYNIGKPIAKTVYKLGDLAVQNFKNPWNGLQNVANSGANMYREKKGLELLPTTNPLEEAQQRTDKAFENFENKVGLTKRSQTKAGKLGQVVGGATGYLAQAYSMGGSPLAYGATSGMQAFGNTNDVGDIAFETAKGTLFGKINSATNNTVVKGIEKIFPATNPLIGEGINVAGSLAKNAVAGGAGTYTATALTGEAGNVYNTLRNSEVTKEDWIKPVWSADTAISALVGAGFGAISGTQADIKARTQYENDVNELVDKLNVYADKFNKSIQMGDQESALDIARASRDELVKFSMNKYGNRTPDTKVVNEVADKWKNYLEQVTNYYTNTNTYTGANYNQPTLNASTTKALGASVLPKEINLNNTNLQSNVQNLQENTQNQSNIGQSSQNNAQKAIENNPTLQPSIENTTENGYNQVGGVENVGQNGYGLTKMVERERQNIGTTEKMLRKEPKITEKELTQQQIKTKNIAKEKYNTNIMYYDGKNVDIKGLATDKNEIYIDRETATIYGSDFVLGHEIAEDMLSNHTDVVINDYNKMIEKIKNSKGFTNLFQDYTEGMPSKQKQQLALNLDKVAKEILCDINAGKNGTSTKLAKIVTDTIKNNLEPQLYNDIIEMFNKYENQIYGKESSTQGSFSLPTEAELKAFDNKQAKEAYEKLHMANETDNVDNIPIEQLITYKDKNGGGYREQEQINSLKENIRKNGIKNPIELITDSKGNITINDGNHRLAIAKELGIRTVPVKYLDENAKKVVENSIPKEYNEAITERRQQNAKGINEARVSSSGQDVRIGVDGGYNATNTVLSNETRATTENSEISGGEQRHNNRPSIDTTRRQNTTGQKIKNKKGFMLVNEGDTYKGTLLNNNAKAINDTIKMKNEAIVQFNQKIALKEQELANKKDKTTKVAQNIERQIINLEKRKADTEARIDKQIDKLENRNATINKQVSEDRLPTRKEVRKKIITEKDLENIDLDNAKDINKFIMNNTTPQRVNEKVFGKETAGEINEKFFKPIKHNEAERIRFLNKEREELANWGIKPKSEESVAVQMYGEGEWVNPETGESTPYTLIDLKKEFPKDWKKIKYVSEKIKEKYDNYLESINSKLNEMGYDSIPKRKDYFRHFEEVTSLFDKIGIPSKADHLPTDLNGLTADLKPGKSFFANALKRRGKKTAYDAIKGIDGYLEGASKLIYHTEDIQNLRTLDEYIRGKYGRNADLEGLSETEFKQRIKQIDEGHLSEYAAWLTEYTNNLAGKKSKIDRGMEELCGRRIYKTLNLLKKQVGSNLTGFNINTALSNFISAGQGLSSTSKIATLQGLIDTIANIAKNDDFIDKSDFLTTRFGSDKLSKEMWEKASESGQIFMGGTDYFTANLITRSKYHEYLNKGYPEQEAIEKADDYADRLMAGRGEGDMPNIFNSKMLGIITQFQLENVNQFDSMFHDNFTEDRASEQTKYEAKTWNEKIKSKVAKANPKFYNGIMSTFVLAELFTAGYAFNKFVKKIGGTGGAFDPFGTIEDFVKDYQNDGLEVATQNLAKNILDDIPYLNLITGGGRIPMKDSLPNIYDLLTGESNLRDEALKLLNVALPTGGGQLRKTWQGATTLINGGEYGKRKSSDGEEKEYAKWILDFDNKTSSEKLVTAMQALFFGKYGTEEAKEYLDNGYKGLTVAQTEAYKKLKETGMSVKNFKEIIETLEKINPKKFDKTGKEIIDSNAKKTKIKEVLNNADITDEQRKILYEIYYKLNVD